MYDSEAIRAAAQALVDAEPTEALERAFRAEATLIAVLSMLDEIERLRALLFAIMTERLIPAEYPLLIARVRAALGGGA